MKILQLEMRIQLKFMNFLANLKEKEVEFYLENTNFAMNMLLLYDLEETSIEAMGNEIENWGSSETLIQRAEESEGATKERVWETEEQDDDDD